MTQRQSRGKESHSFSFQNKRVFQLVFLKPCSNLIDVETDFHCPVKNGKDKEEKEINTNNPEDQGSEVSAQPFNEQGI